MTDWSQVYCPPSLCQSPYWEDVAVALHSSVPRSTKPMPPLLTITSNTYYVSPHNWRQTNWRSWALPLDGAIPCTLHWPYGKNRWGYTLSRLKTVYQRYKPWPYHHSQHMGLCKYATWVTTNTGLLEPFWNCLQLHNGDQLPILAVLRSLPISHFAYSAPCLWCPWLVYYWTSTTQISQPSSYWLFSHLPYYPLYPPALKSINYPPPLTIQAPISYLPMSATCRPCLTTTVATTDHCTGGEGAWN